ncbi:MAG TPA: hypothetical protein VLB12_15795, partial [Gemmatimonadales bacterium]|nr:hypothetical protein [Gemmatimonadales bacterium]
CLFCNQSLGSNEAIEAFPVGRRLAFDQRRGRLWVVCRKCEKWNLTPLEERWEAIESCEKLFRDTRKRVSTDNIGLARLAEGLELVRIGDPMRPEFAAWRYGDQFKRRFRRYLGWTIGGAVGYSAFATAGVVGAAAGSLALGFWQFLHMSRDIIWDRRIVARVPDGAGGLLNIRRSDALQSSLVADESPQRWALQLRVGLSDRHHLVVGDEARRVAARIVPVINRIGGFQSQVDRAVEQLERFGGPEWFLAWAARNPPTKFFSDKHWLAIEMAINEENERHALATELAHLEQAWKEAEEIAAIADNLALPRDVESRLDSLRSRSRNN